MKLSSKKGLILSILSLILVAVILIGASIAFFTDRGEVTNTFTMGKVKIGLDEPNWGRDAGLGLLPGNIRAKDPTVTAIEGKSYMRIRMEIVDGEGKLIKDAGRMKLILDTLYYDTAYNGITSSQYLKEGQHYSVNDLKVLTEQKKIQKEYNHDVFAFAGIVKDNPAIRYYNYIGGNGIFDASGTPADKAVLFSNIVIPKDWNNEEIFILSGDTYETTANGGLEVTVRGSGYKLIMKAEAIQESDMTNAAEAFKALDEATGVIRDTSGA